MRRPHQTVIAAAIAGLSLFAVNGVNAAEHVIEMKNKNAAGQAMMFEPDFIKVEVGDTVRFVPVDKPHNAESVPKVWPADVPPVKGEMDKEVTFKAEKEGLFLFKCLPHYGMGMIALVQVGKATPSEELKALKGPKKVQEHLAKLLEKVQP